MTLLRAWPRRQRVRENGRQAGKVICSVELTLLTEAKKGKKEKAEPPKKKPRQHIPRKKDVPSKKPKKKPKKKPETEEEDEEEQEEEGKGAESSTKSSIADRAEKYHHGRAVNVISLVSYIMF